MFGTTYFLFLLSLASHYLGVIQPMYMYMVCIYVFGCMDGCHTLQSNIIDASKSNPFWGGILHLDRDKLQSHVKTMNYRRILVDHVTDKVVAQFDTL